MSEYKEIATHLHRSGVLSEEEMRVFRMLGGYRNRLVHLYHEVTLKELYEICTFRLSDIERTHSALRRWLEMNPQKLDDTL